MAKFPKGEAKRIYKLLFAKKKIVDQLDTWEDAKKHNGLKAKRLRDEKGQPVKTPEGDELWSVRLKKKDRMLVYVRGQEVVAWSVHPDHDSAYKSRR